MKLEMSEENSKRVLSGVKWIINASQNYKSNSSGKKLINAFLLLPIIVPTVIMGSLIVCTYFFLSAVSVQKDDSKLSKVVKGLARILIYIVAAVVLIPCAILNLVISLIPFLIFRAINKDIFNQKDTNIEDNQGQTVNKVNGEEYSTLIEEEVNKLGQQDNTEQDQPTTNSCQPLTSNPPHNRPTVKVISRVVDNTQVVDQTTIVEDINNDNIRDGKAMVRIAGNDSCLGIGYIAFGYDTNQHKGFAFAGGFSCKLVKGGDGKASGVDVGLGLSVRAGANKQEAERALKQSELARTMLSPGNGGMLSIEQCDSTRRNEISS
ncbi:ABC transporter permease subunit [Wolbachia pipientis]|uniref:hypothetical protein n=1 Tax=Wolbachia pipientis TaxID=955 RepID=UPI0020301A09|nr:hypothetical protein [Wolbachia pipientis]MCM1002562.1 hypothetical protein [Wolbachia pipientis]